MTYTSTLTQTPYKTWLWSYTYSKGGVCFKDKGHAQTKAQAEAILTLSLEAFFA